MRLNALLRLPWKISSRAFCRKRKALAAVFINIARSDPQREQSVSERNRALQTGHFKIVCSVIISLHEEQQFFQFGQGLFQLGIVRFGQGLVYSFVQVDNIFPVFFMDLRDKFARTFE